MRLLDAWTLIYDGEAELVEFVDEQSLPPYAILSHTWAEEEVLFHDIALGPDHEIMPSKPSLRTRHRRNRTHPELIRPAKPHVKVGWNKVLNTCLQACRDGFEYVWIDTCCIDKSSSAELSEAINSMYRWYSMATVCYVHLAGCALCPALAARPAPAELELLDRRLMDEAASGWNPLLSGTEVERACDALILNECTRAQLRICRWFTRGWTLQELLASCDVHFFDQNWHFIARRCQIIPTLHSVTNIHCSALRRDRGDSIARFSIAQRMYWASKRSTTRLEDEAYCLLGLFRINMPLLYGEGRRAFKRLQEEIAKVSSDHSIYAWELRPEESSDYEHMYSLFAPSPANFWWYAHWIETSYRSLSTPNHQMTNQGVELQVELDSWRQKHYFPISIADLNCKLIDRSDSSDWLESTEYNIGLRVRNPVLVPTPYRSETQQLQDRLFTHVEPERVSTPHEPEPTFRRLVGIPWVGHEDQIAEPARVIMLVALEASPRFAIADASALALTRPGGFSPVAKVKISVPLSTLGRRAWRVTAAYPPTQWHALDQTMILPTGHGRVYGGVAIRSDDSNHFQCDIIFGSPSDPRIDDKVEPATGQLHYWLFRRLESDWTDSFGALPDNVPEPLAILCRKIASFPSRDYFESTNKRVDGNKSVLLPNRSTVFLAAREPYWEYDADYGSIPMFPLELIMGGIAIH